MFGKGCPVRDHGEIDAAPPDIGDAHRTALGSGQDSLVEIGSGIEEGAAQISGGEGRGKVRRPVADARQVWVIRCIHLAHQMRLVEVGPLQVRHDEVGPLQMRLAEAGPLQVRHVEAGPLQVRLVEVGPFQVRLAEVGPLIR